MLNKHGFSVFKQTNTRDLKDGIRKEIYLGNILDEFFFNLKELVNIFYDCLLVLDGSSLLEREGLLVVGAGAGATSSSRGSSSS